MKKFILAFFMILALPAFAQDYRLSYTITVTNAPSVGDTITINGDTRTGTNTAQTASAFLIGADVGESTTNLFNHFAAFPVSGLTLIFSATNQITFRSRAINTPLTVSASGNWATLTLNSNVVANPIPVTVPLAAEPNPDTRTAVGSYLVTAINDYSTNIFAATATALSNFVSLSEAQTITGNKTNTGTNVFWNAANEFHGRFYGEVNAASGTLSGVELFPVLIDGGIISGMGGSITNGLFKDITIDGGTATNLVNYGNAFSSPGSGISSEQFGTGAQATAVAATAIGQAAEASGVGSISIGSASAAVNSQTIAIGADAVAGGTNSISIGGFAVTSQKNSIAIGVQAVAEFENSVAIGYGATATSTNQFVIGSTNVDHVITPGRIEAQQGYTNALFTGTNAFRGDVAFEPGTITTLATGNNAGVNPGSKIYVRLTGPTDPFAVCGISGGRDGRFLVLQNSSSYPMTIRHESGVDPTATNRILTPSEADVVVSGNPGFAILIYDSSVSRWLLISTSN